MASFRSERLRIKLLSTNKNADEAKKDYNKMTNAERCKKYREMLKNNPKEYERQKIKNNKRNKENRRKLKDRSPETIARNREMCKLRMRRMRARKKSEDRISADRRRVSSSTRSKVKKKKLEVSEQREKWRIYKMKERSKWSAQKWISNREKLRKNYHKKKQELKTVGDGVSSSEVQTVQASTTNSTRSDCSTVQQQETSSTLTNELQNLKHKRSKDALIKKKNS